MTTAAQRTIAARAPARIEVLRLAAQAAAGIADMPFSLLRWEDLCAGLVIACVSTFLSVTR
jgi:hypothetical protein